MLVKYAVPKKKPLSETFCKLHNVDIKEYSSYKELGIEELCSWLIIRASIQHFLFICILVFC